MTRHIVMFIRLFFFFSNSDIASGRPTTPVGIVSCQNIADQGMHHSVRKCGGYRPVDALRAKSQECMERSSKWSPIPSRWRTCEHDATQSVLEATCT
jgi:hypothetical protein